MTQPTITIRSRWQSKRLAVKVIITRVTLREVSYMALDSTFSGTVPQRQFLQDFEPVTKREKKRR